MKNLYCFDVRLLPVVFPECQIISEALYVPRNAIYIGRDTVMGDESAMVFKRMLGKGVDISLPDRTAILNYVYAKKGAGAPTKSIEKYVIRMQDDAFSKELNRFMAVGKWVKSTEVDTKVYELFDALTQSKSHFLKVYFSLRETYSLGEVWSSVLTFFQRVVSFSNESDFSDFYKAVILKFKTQSDRIASVASMVMEDNFDELGVINFLLGIRY